MNSRLLASAVLLICAASASPALAQSWPDVSTPPAVEKAGPNDAAVVVAVEDYAFLPDVPGATKNAADWEAFLSDGLGVGTVLMLTNQQAVREEILSFAKKGAGEVGEGGTLWFIFIGHGGPAKSGDDGLLIGADGQQNAKSMAARGLPQKELLAALGGGKQARTVVLIDACFSGRDSSGGALAKGTMPVLPVNVAPKVSKTTVVMTAAKSDEFAGDLPGADRPAFSYLVLGGLRGWADDGDGEVTADEAVKFARRQLLGISGRQQTPQLVGGDGLVLARGGTEPAPKVGGVVATTAPEPTEPVEGPPVGDQKSMQVVDPKYTDGVPDSPIYFGLTGGVAAVGDFGSFGPTGDVSGGVKLNGFTGGKSEWRVGLRFALASSANSDAPTDGVLVSDGQVFSDDKVSDRSDFSFVVGPEVGKSWRSEKGPRAGGDSVFTLSLMGLYGSQSTCDTWQLDTSSGSREINCETKITRAGPGGGVGAAFQYGVLRFGAKFAFLADLGVFSSLNAGIAFDN